jgi:hypothetical protein
MVIFDIEALGELDVPLPSLTATKAERRDFWAAWERASADREASYLQGDRTAHRKAWEDGQ